MTGTEFRTLHGDPTTWTTTDIETQQNLAAIDDLTRTCWFCAAENPRTRNTCGFCNHRADDGPDSTHLLAGGVTRAGKSQFAETLTALNSAA